MKERGMLFSKSMVLALLDGSKTQTRRIVKPQPTIDAQGNFCWNGWNFGQTFEGPRIQAIASPLPSSKTKKVHCPYGKPGDRIWVRETGWERPERSPKMLREGADTWERYYYDADGWTDLEHDQFKEWGFKRRPCIHMPRWASRIDLEITGVRVERLQDISEADAKAEGIESAFDGTRWRMYDHCDGEEKSLYVGPRWTIDPIRSYKSLWLSINGAGSWDANPWIWVIEFRRVKP